MSDMSINDAIEAIKNEIDTKQRQLERLHHFDEMAQAGLSEEQYHDFCQTDMRYSDLLGKALVTSMPFLTYIKKEPNYFYYNIENTDLAVKIPNSLCTGVEIIIDKYYRDDDELVSCVTRKYKLDDNIRSQKILTYTAFLNTRSVLKRACLVAPSNQSLAKLLISYVINNKKENYEKKITDQLAKLKKEEAQIKIAKLRELETRAAAYKKQMQDIEYYAAQFLEWTDKVQIRIHASNIVKIEYTVRDGKMTAKIYS